MKVKELREAQMFGRSGSVLGQVLVAERAEKVVLPGRKEPPTGNDQEQQFDSWDSPSTAPVVAVVNSPGLPWILWVLNTCQLCLPAWAESMLPSTPGQANWPH